MYYIAPRVHKPREALVSLLPLIRVDDCIMSQGELWVTLTKLFQTVPIYDLPYPWLAEAILIHSSLVLVQL